MSKFDDRCLETLAEMIKIRTVSKDGERTANVEKFVDYIRQRFPNIFAKCGYTDFDGGIMLKLEGKMKEKQPLILMSHLDVVDADEKEWSFSPFSGKIEDGKILGRGTADTKGSLCAMLEALELLLKENFETTSDIYILSSSREEIAGKDAEQMAKYFVDNKIRPKLLVDEGGAVLDKPMSGVNGQYAMLAMSERASLKVFFKGDRSEELAVRLRKMKLSKSVMPLEVEEMFKRLSPNMSFPMSLLFKNLKIFKRLLVKLLPKVSSQAGAMVKPTVTVKDSKDGKLLTVACTYYHQVENIYKKVIDMCKECGVDYKVEHYRITPRPTDFNREEVKLVERTVVETFEKTIPTPFIIFGGTDARHFVDVADCVVRFAPLIMTNEIISRVHKADEYIFTNSIIKAVEFYYNLVKNFSSCQ